MRSFIPSFLATICAVAVVATPAQAQRGWRGGNNYGSYRGNGYYGNNNGYYGNYNGYNYGNNGGYGYYYPRGSNYGGYNSPQYSYGSGQYYSNTPYYSDSTAYNTMPDAGATTASNYADPNANSRTWFKVIVLDPATRLTIQDQLMQQTGTERQFYTPILERGKVYVYTFRATSMENGQEVTREKKIDVAAGQNILINFADRNTSPPSTGEPIVAMPVAPFTGEFVRMDGDQMVFVVGDKERSFRMAPNGRVTVGGILADAQAIRPGMKVTVTTQPNSTSIATSIEAIQR